MSLKNILNTQGDRYFITFIGKFYTYSNVFIIKHKSEGFEKKKKLFSFKKVAHRFVKKRRRRRRRIVQSHKYMEYGSIGFKYFIQLHGILYHHKVVDSYSFSSDDIVERQRQNNILINLLNSMLISFCALENLQPGTV